MAPRPANPRLAHDLIQTAAKLVEEYGAEGVTMRRVAERLGYSPTTIYLYFASKEQLLDETVNHSFGWFGDHLEHAAEGEDPARRIRQTAHAYLDWGIENPGLYRLMFEWRYLGDVRPEAIFARRTGWRRMREVLDLGVKQGAYRPDLDTGVATDTIWASMHGLTSLTISGRMFGNPPDMVRPEVAAQRAHALVDAFADSWEAAWRA